MYTDNDNKILILMTNLELSQYIGKTLDGFSGGNYTSTILRIWAGFTLSNEAVIYADLQIGKRTQKMQIIGDSKGLFYTIN